MKVTNTKETAMYHSGDEFEARARAARHQELRHLSGALVSFLFGARPARKHKVNPAANTQDIASGSSVHNFNRAA